MLRHKWLDAEYTPQKWQRLQDGELVSPLKPAAEDRLVQAVAVGVEKFIDEEEPQLPENQDLSWLAPFDIS